MVLRKEKSLLDLRFSKFLLFLNLLHPLKPIYDFPHFLGLHVEPLTLAFHQQVLLLCCFHHCIQIFLAVCSTSMMGLIGSGRPPGLRTHAQGEHAQEQLELLINHVPPVLPQAEFSGKMCHQGTNCLSQGNTLADFHAKAAARESIKIIAHVDEVHSAPLKIIFIDSPRRGSRWWSRRIWSSSLLTSTSKIHLHVELFSLKVT